MKPTPIQVWEATIADQNFVAKMPEGSRQREAIRPFIEGAVEALADQLENYVTIQTLVEAKFAYLRWCIENGLGRVMAEATGTNPRLIEPVLGKMFKMLEEMCNNLPALLERHSITEEQLMRDPKLGMNADNIEKWRSGVLTIGELLVTQPAIILSNEP